MAILAMRPFRGPMLLMPSMPADRRNSSSFSTPSEEEVEGEGEGGMWSHLPIEKAVFRVSTMLIIERLL